MVNLMKKPVDPGNVHEPVHPIKICIMNQYDQQNAEYEILNAIGIEVTVNLSVRCNKGVK